jgi:hypothetical protein
MNLHVQAIEENDKYFLFGMADKQNNIIWKGDFI